VSKNPSEPALSLANISQGPELAASFREHGRVQIPDILNEQSANAIHDCLQNLQNWNLVFNKDGKHVDTDAADVANWPYEQQTQLEEIIHTQAIDGFQYFYSALPVYDIYHKKLMPGHFVNRLFEFLNSDEFLSLMRSVTCDDSIAFADAQATRYEQGHFLTRHDDDVVDKNRRAAFVLNLTRNWNPDWGGALQFFDADGNISCGFTPAFNVLNMFRVPASHSVGLVAPFARGNRYSITGWLRSGKDPMLGSHQ